MTGIEYIEKERQHQLAKGYDSKHDDYEKYEELSLAAMVYACPLKYKKEIKQFWPWNKEYYKGCDSMYTNERIKELSKAGALIVAEIERLQRAKDMMDKKRYNMCAQCVLRRELEKIFDPEIDEELIITLSKSLADEVVKTVKTVKIEDINEDDIIKATRNVLAEKLKSNL